MKTTTPHTPEPWTVNPHDAQVMDSSNESICLLLWPTKIRSEDETKANARLIAAAPELLNALEKMLEYYAPAARKTAKTEGISALVSYVQDAINAIDKAKGEEA